MYKQGTGPVYIIEDTFHGEQSKGQVRSDNPCFESDYRHFFGWILQHGGSVYDAVVDGNMPKLNPVNPEGHKLHNHPKMEKRLGVPSDHVIIDRDTFGKLLASSLPDPFEKSLEV